MIVTFRYIIKLGEKEKNIGQWCVLVLLSLSKKKKKKKKKPKKKA
jgi:hypothetical protein